MDLVQMPKIFDTKTGEVLQVNKLQPKTIEAFLKTLDDQKVSEILTQLNFVRKVADKIEKTTKNYIKNKLPEFEGETYFGDWRIKKVGYARFSEGKLLKEGTPRDIADWKRIKAKYTETSDSLRFG